MEEGSGIVEEGIDLGCVGDGGRSGAGIAAGTVSATGKDKGLLG